MIKVLVADGNYLARKGMCCLLLEGNTSSKLVGEASSHEDMLECMLIHQPDVLIIDYTSESFSLQSVAKALTACLTTKVLAITPNPDKNAINKAFSSGVKSYLLKECDEEEIIEAIHATAKGNKFVCGKILDRLVNGEQIEQLTAVSCDGGIVSEREMEIIKLIAEGNSNKEIAEKLFLSTHTVMTHRKNIMAKLGVNNTAGVVLFAVRENLISPNHFLFNN